MTDTRKLPKVCLGCGKKKPIRRDRKYCSVACANKHIASENKANQTALVIGDAHIPYHDDKATDLILQWVQDHKPDAIYFNGDIIDCYHISRFAQPGVWDGGFKVEIERTQQWLSDFRTESPRSRMVYIEGNHEFRLRSMMNNDASALQGCKGMTIPEQLELDKLNIEYVCSPGDKWFSTYVWAFPDMLVGHFAKTSQHSAYAVKGLVEMYGVSLVTGHNHSGGMHHRTFATGDLAGYEGGCLCDLQPTYCEPHNWTHGFVVLNHRDGRTYPEPVRITDHRFYYGGKLYG
jgi:predicted phosphodiesterase